VSDREFEQLVQTIADRVRAEMMTAPSTSGPVTPRKPCTAGKKSCVGCGWSVSRRAGDTRKIIDIGATRVSAKAAGLDPKLVRGDLARYIDHTMLTAKTSRDELKKLCAEAAEFKFASVCVNPANVSYCVRALRGSGVAVCTVVGFPLGATTGAAKAFEAKEAVRAGATEIDMVINIGALKSGDYATVLDDIQKVVQASSPAIVKVILETGELNREEKVIACALSKVAGAAFVKTSTGFGPGGATAEDVALMKAVVGAELEVKASGGVRDASKADVMIAAGATRIGASASVAIVKGATKIKGAKTTTGGAKRAVGGY
jgi:deoxyribose-phosphate aldolase